MKMNLYDLIINHPGRILTLQCISYHCTAATPPSKGGESYNNLSCHKTTLSLTAKPPKGEAGALRNSLAGYFSEQAGLPRWLSLQAGSFAKPAHRAGSIRSALPLEEGWEGGKQIKNQLEN